MPYWSFDIGGEKLVWYTRQWPRIAKYMVQSLLLMVAMEGRTGAVQDQQSPQMAEWFNHSMLVQIRKLLELSTDEQSYNSRVPNSIWWLTHYSYAWLAAPQHGQH